VGDDQQGEHRDQVKNFSWTGSLKKRPTGEEKSDNGSTESNCQKVSRKGKNDSKGEQQNGKVENKFLGGVGRTSMKLRHFASLREVLRTGAKRRGWKKVFSMKGQGISFKGGDRLGKIPGKEDIFVRMRKAFQYS